MGIFDVPTHPQLWDFVGSDFVGKCSDSISHHMHPCPSL